jgi:glucose-1-phosphate adenylyltransferase
VIDAHFDHKADVTMVTTTVPIEQASRFGTVEVDDTGRVVTFAYKPEQPRSSIVTTEVFVYNASRLLQVLEELVANTDDADNDDTPLKDFGDELLPRLVAEGRAYAFPLDGYWRDVGVIEAYWQAHMDLLATEPALELDEAAWPILTYGNQRMPARIWPEARIKNSLIAPGCDVRGIVIDSVLAPGVVVAEGAIIWRSVVLHDTRIEHKAQVGASIVDTHVSIGSDSQVGQTPDDSPLPQADAPPHITVLGRGACIEAGSRIQPGKHIEPNNTDG